MKIKSSYPSFKRLAPAGTLAALSVLLAACGGGPINGESAAAGTSPGQNALSLNGSGSGNADNSAIQRCLTTGEGCGGLALTYDQWKQSTAQSAEDRKQAEEQKAKLTEEARRKEEQQRRDRIRQLAYQMLDNDDNGKLKYIIVGLDKETLTEPEPVPVTPSANAGAGQDASAAPLLDKDKKYNDSFVSLHAHDVYEYYNRRCPVTAGADPKELFSCMAGIYVGRNKSGGPCYTSIKRDGTVRHVNDNFVVYDFKHDIAHSQPGPATPSVPEFTRLDVGGNMFMMVNVAKTYANPDGIKQKLDTDQTFRIQQMVFKFDSEKETIDIFQRNTDEDWKVGTGGFQDTCYVSFNRGIDKEATPEAPPQAGGSGAGKGQGA